MSLSKFAASSLGSATKSSLPTLGEQSTSDSNSNLPFGLNKWQLALIIGTPIVIGAAAYYYYSQDTAYDATDGTGSSNSSSKASKLKSNKSSSAIKVKSSSSNSTTTPKKANLQLPKEILAKNKGNEFFKSKKYQEAADCYTEAINLCPPNKKEDLATFYQNRAAANEYLQVPVDKIIDDCSEAIKLNNKYTKALTRRAIAFEKVGKLEDALVDITSACILENFANQNNLVTTDRILRSLSKTKARQFIKNRQPTLPSNQFIQHYFSSYTRDPLFPGDRQINSDKLTNKFVELTTSTTTNNSTNVINDARVNLLKGTIEILKGNCEAAEKYLNDVINISQSTNSTDDQQELINLKVNALIKLATISVNLVDEGLPLKSGDELTDKGKSNNIERALKYFDGAIKLDSSNADIYIHRSQILILSEKVEESKKDLELCIKLSPDFGSAIAQKYYIDFNLAMKYGQVDNLTSILKEFEEAANKYSSSSEILSLFAQSLMEIESFDAADKYFLKAIQADPYDANLYVHRALVLLRRNGDADQALKLVRKGVETDPRCQFAHEMLGTLLVQAGKLDEAIKSFDLAIECAQTETDCDHLFSLKDAAVAQIKAAKALGITFQG